MDNTSILNQLLAQGKIALESVPFLNRAPSPLPEDWDFARVEGMLLGLAIGDALGNTTESQLPTTRRQSHGEIRDYLPSRYANGRPMGVPSDDTQMTFWTLEHLLEDGGLVPDHLALGKREKIEGLARLLNGRLYLMRGNHDRRGNSCHFLA